MNKGNFGQGQMEKERRSRIEGANERNGLERGLRNKQGYVGHSPYRFYVDGKGLCSTCPPRRRIYTSGPPSQLVPSNIASCHTDCQRSSTTLVSGERQSCLFGVPVSFVLLLLATISVSSYRSLSGPPADSVSSPH